jgi:hypothetical protein
LLIFLALVIFKSQSSNLPKVLKWQFTEALKEAEEVKRGSGRPGKLGLSSDVRWVLGIGSATVETPPLGTQGTIYQGSRASAPPKVTSRNSVFIFSCTKKCGVLELS